MNYYVYVKKEHSLPEEHPEYGPPSLVGYSMDHEHRYKDKPGYRKTLLALIKVPNERAAIELEEAICNCPDYQVYRREDITSSKEVLFLPQDIRERIRNGEWPDDVAKVIRKYNGRRFL